MTAEGSRAADRLCKNGFERTYVRERQWLTPDEYGGLVALCQMVPGPASSQVSYLIGLRRAGWGGAFAAWAGFTLPSAIVMSGFALLAPHLEGPATNAVLHGLKLGGRGGGRAGGVEYGAQPLPGSAARRIGAARGSFAARSSRSNP